MTTTPQTRTIYFIDERVEDYATLVAGLPVSSEWFLLQVEQDGVAQMAAVLRRADYRELDSIAVLCHGHPGGLLLGATWLTQENLAATKAYALHLAEIGQSLT